VGERSGVRRFNSGERAFSSQTSPGRFVRLGLTVAVLSAATAAVMSACEAATGAEALTTAAASTAGAGAASVGAAAANVEQSTITMVQDGLAANTVSMASAETVASSPSGFRQGMAAASTVARNLLMNIAHNPMLATHILSQATSESHQGLSAAQPKMFEARRYVESQHGSVISATKALFRELGVNIPKSLTMLFDSAFVCRNLCEILVDTLEAAGPLSSGEIATSIQSFLEDLQG